MTDVAVVIVSWNVRALLAACLRSVAADLAGSGLHGEVWVVDNASSDGSAGMVETEFPAVKLIASPENLGFAGGNNTALRAMGFDEAGRSSDDRPEMVLLLNPDTEVHPGALAALFSFMRRTPPAGVVGARLVYGDGSFQPSMFGFPGLGQLAIELLPLPGRLVESRLNGRFPRAWYEQGRPFKVWGHPLGAAMGVRGAAIEQVGLLDEGYHMYVEEIDWSRRLAEAGWQIFCVPQAVITHLGGQSTGQIRWESFIDLWRSRYRFYQKFYAPLKLWLAGQIVRLGMQRKAAAATRAGQTQQVAYYEQVIDIWQGKQE